MPPESDDEDWYERRKRIDLEERLEEAERMTMPIQKPLMLARDQAIALAGVNSPTLPYPAYEEPYERTYRPVPEGQSVRLPYSSRPVMHPVPLHPEERQRNIADRLVGDALQLGRYMDETVVGVARRELAEAYEMDERELESAAFTLTNPEYLEHVGGLHPEEFSDINQYSQRSLLRPANTMNPQNSSGDTTANTAGTSDDDLLLVTTL